MRPLKLKRHLTNEQDRALRSPVPLDAEEKHFDPENFVGPYEDAEAYKEDGTLLFRVVADAFDMKHVLKAYEHLRTVNGDPTTRTSVTGGGRVTRPRADGTPSRQSRSSKAKSEEYKKKGVKADFLGYMDREPGFPFCRQTAWTAKNPEVLKNCWKLINKADSWFQKLIPDRHKFQGDHIDEHLDFTLGATVFSTVTVNKKLSTTYHRDKNDLKGGFGVMFTLGDFTGGQLVFPAFRCAVDYQPGSIILADVHETHGNLKNIVGNRITCVLYAREKINECGTAEEELERAKGMDIFGRED